MSRRAAAILSIGLVAIVLEPVVRAPDDDVAERFAPEASGATGVAVVLLRLRLVARHLHLSRVGQDQLVDRAAGVFRLEHFGRSG